MDRARALDIITALASGVDPLSGETFTAASTLQHPDVIRALFLAAIALQDNSAAAKKGTARDPNLPANAGSAWSEAEDQRLIDAFEAGASEKELGATHGRTPGAIRARLIRLGKLEPSGNGRRS